MITAHILRSLDRSAWIFLILVLGIAVALPFLNLLLPPTSPFHVPTYLVTLFGKYVCYALLALSIDLIWGYCGILSLGHGAFFALGGYAMGMYLMRQIGTRGVYAHPILPDFMVFLNWPELPVYWYGFQYFPYALLMVVLVPGFLAFVFGWFAFRSRVTGVYFSIITQALTFALMLGFFRNNFGFGGNNGLTDFKEILGFNVQAPGTRVALFSISCIALALAFLVCRAIITSKFGKVLIAIRDAETRTRFLGYRVESYKLFVFTLSACMAGIAGALYVPQVGIINPSEFAPANSIEAVIWVAVGGRGTLTGAALGAILVNYGKTTFTTGALAPYWLFVLGGLFVAVTLLLPRGIVGLFQEVPSWLRQAATNPIAFASTYLLLWGGPFVLIGGVLLAVEQLGNVGEGIGLTLVLCLQIVCWILLFALAYHRGRALGREWLVLLPVLAAVGSFANWHPLLVAAFHSVCIVCGAALRARNSVLTRMPPMHSPLRAAPRPAE